MDFTYNIQPEVKAWYMVKNCESSDAGPFVNGQYFITDDRKPGDIGFNGDDWWVLSLPTFHDVLPSLMSKSICYIFQCILINLILCNIDTMN